MGCTSGSVRFFLLPEILKLVPVNTVIFQENTAFPKVSTETAEMEK